MYFMWKEGNVLFYVYPTERKVPCAVKHFLAANLTLIEFSKNNTRLYVGLSIYSVILSFRPAVIESSIAAVLETKKNEFQYK